MVEIVSVNQGQKGAVEQRARIFAALADPTRLRLVEQLGEAGERSGSELAERAKISLALACHHLKVLTDAGVIARRKSGQSTYYTLVPEALSEAFHSLLG